MPTMKQIWNTPKQKVLKKRAARLEAQLKVIKKKRVAQFKKDSKKFRRKH